MTDDELDQQIKHHYQEADRLAKERKERRAKKKKLDVPAWARTVQAIHRQWEKCELEPYSPTNYKDKDECVKAVKSGLNHALADLEHAWMFGHEPLSPFLTDFLHGLVREVKRGVIMLDTGRHEPRKG